MARAHFTKSIVRRASGAPANGNVTIYLPGTTTKINQTIFTTDDGATALTNPFSFTAGVIDFYLDIPTRVKLVITPFGAGDQVFDDVDVIEPVPEIDPDASPTTKGLIRLGGDLAGTAEEPKIPALLSKVSNTDPRLTNERPPPDEGVTTPKLANNAVTISKVAPSVRETLNRADTALQEAQVATLRTRVTSLESRIASVEAAGGGQPGGGGGGNVVTPNTYQSMYTDTY